MSECDTVEEYSVREFLNHPGFNSHANLIASMQVTKETRSHYRDRYDPIEHDVTRISTTFKVTDCTRSICLDFSFDSAWSEEAALDNSMYKLKLLRDTLDEMYKIASKYEPTIREQIRYRLHLEAEDEEARQTAECSEEPEASISGPA